MVQILKIIARYICKLLTKFIYNKAKTFLYQEKLDFKTRI